MIRKMLAPVALGAACLWAASSWAGSRPVEDFVGHYTGSAMSKTEDSSSLGFEMRDLDVVIASDGAGFTVSWTNVSRPRNGGETRRRAHSIAFLPTPGAATYRPAGQGDPTAGGELAWARIAGDTLSVYLMTVSPDGIYEMQQYARTLTPKGMDLTFTRLRDGERVRKVTGKLQRD